MVTSLSPYELISFIYFLFRLRVGSSLSVYFSFFRTFLGSGFSTIRTRIVISYVYPLISYVMAVRVATGFVHLLSMFFRFFFYRAIALRYAVGARFLVYVGGRASGV